MVVPTERPRLARVEDASVILTLIKELAAYEELEHAVVATESDLIRSLFCESPKARVLLIENEREAIGFALFFENYSTFLGKSGLYLEDLFVRPSYRGQGYGRLLLQYLAKIGVQQDCERIDWNVLEWNESAMEFYEAMGAKRVPEWIPFRLSGVAINGLAGED